MNDALMNKLLRITKAVQRRATSNPTMNREMMAGMVRAHLLSNKILTFVSIKDSSREVERSLRGAPSRVHVRVCITFKDIESGDADWRDWHGEVLMHDGDGLLEAVENATESFLLATFGLFPATPEAAPAAPQPPGNNRPPANSYKNRTSEFLTLLAKKLKSVGRFTTTDDMRKLIEQAEAHNLLRPDMTYQQAADAVMTLVQQAAQ